MGGVDLTPPDDLSQQQIIYSVGVPGVDAETMHVDSELLISRCNPEDTSRLKTAASSASFGSAMAPGPASPMGGERERP
jgi:hypothetical protein